MLYSQAHFDEYEHYNFDQDKTIFTGHGGKCRGVRGEERLLLTRLISRETAE